MAKLLKRLSDASKSGVYRSPGTEAIVAAARGSQLRLTRIGLDRVAGKEALLDAIAAALEFPAHFGRNWDALEDCLADLSWLQAGGHVLLFEGEGLPAPERAPLIEVLRAVASTWADGKRPFFAVFVGGAPDLPSLYRD